MTIPANTHADDRFRRVDAVFDAAFDLPTAEQAAYIERACADDAEVRAEVLQLLRAHHRPGSLLDSPAVRLAPLLVTDDAWTSTAPARIGAFRVTRRSGRAAWASVFLGERADGQFEQRVAIKLIRHPAPGLVRRFLEERRILALLEHPNIARLIDGGITADGPAVLRDGVRRRRADRPLLRRRREPLARRAARAVRERVRRRRLRAPAPHHPSRPQAVEHPRHA